MVQAYGCNYICRCSSYKVCWREILSVKFDAETQETINYNGKSYKYISQGTRGYNELAADILNGQMSYPTTVFIDEEYHLLFPVPGYLEPTVFTKVLNYVGTNSYKSMSWDKFDAEN